MTRNHRRRAEVQVERDWNPAERQRALENQLTTGPNNRGWTLRQEINPGHMAEEIAKRLDNASHLLVDRLFEYLSNIPADESARNKNTNGLTLPASAIGWLSTQMYPRSSTENNTADAVPEGNESAWMGASMRDRLALLKYLLPRATHLRIVNTPWPPPFKDGKATDRTMDFVGHDVDSGHLSVHSGVTMETSFVATPNIQSFLLFFNQMQNRPRVDLQVFPKLSVLLLDQVPPEWVVNLRAIPDTLKLIRCEKGCIFDLTRFLFGSSTTTPPNIAVAAIGEDEDVLVQPKSQQQFPKLTNLAYLKLNNTGLGEMSGLRGRRTQKQPEDVPEEVDEHDVLRVASLTAAMAACPPPLSRLPNLISLSLAHNEIRTVRTALSGLSSLSNLKRLDLSYNRLRTMKGANQMLGNVKTLVLTGNSLENVAGLDKLYSVETLFLNENNFEDLNDVAGLGNLPDLMSLFLQDNPFIEKDPLRYRVNVLDLFKSTRFYALLAGATYRHLLQILPMLDGAAATKRELVGLRSLTFRRVLPPVEAAHVEPESTAEGDPAEPLSAPVEPSVIPDQFKVTAAIRPRRVTRKKRKGKAIVRESTTASDGNAESVQKLKSSLIANSSKSLRKIDFSAQDVVSSLALKPEKKKKKETIKPGITILVDDSRNGQDTRSFASVSSVSHHTADGSSVPDDAMVGSTKTDTLFEQAQAAIEAADASNVEDDKVNLLDNYSAASLIPREPKAKPVSVEPLWEDHNESTVTPIKQNGALAQVDETDDVPQKEDSKKWIKSPGRVGKVLLHRDDSKRGANNPIGKVGRIKLNRDNNKTWIKSSGGKAKGNLKRDSSGTNFDDVTPRRATTTRSQSSNPFDDDDDDEQSEIPGSPSRNLTFDMMSPSEIVDYLPRPSVEFPERVWEDGTSVTSSLGTGRASQLNFPAEDKYRDAEETSVYDGPEGYKKLSVIVNLELYFRLFVFPTKDPDVDTSFDFDDDVLSKIAVEASPRIQLRPVDRKVATKSVKEAVGSAKLMMGLRETFKKVLQEEIIACGKSAARRVTPQKKLRRGFHGDPAFSDGSIGFSSESRKVVLCTSDVAIYFIPDYDSVSMKLAEQTTRRKFPSPIPQEALFQNGVWPHALARLPLDTLHRITIGFAFQRLTLHFAPSSDLERSVLGNALTFILATSDKMTTVKLLQHLQDLTKEVEERYAGKFPHSVVIDNDDKQVLDALSVAVAPCPVDVVLHYQILQQRWKHGDRGTVRRACVITDTHIFLLDEDYVGDGSESYDAGSRTLGEVRYDLVDSAELNQIVEVQAASVDPQAITIVVQPQSRLQRKRNWRLFCRDGNGAERLVEDARKAMSSVSQEMQIS